MDTIIANIKTKYQQEAERLLVPVDSVQDKIFNLTKGIATLDQTFIKAKEKVRDCEKDTSHLISESKDEFVVDRALDDTVTAKLKLSTISDALDEANTNLESLKTEKTGLLQDRAAHLRDLIADSYGDFQALFFIYIEQVHKLAITWQALPDTLSEEYGDKYCKRAVVDNPLAPLSFGKFGRDLKSIIEGTGSWETEHFGSKPN